MNLRSSSKRGGSMFESCDISPGKYATSHTVSLTLSMYIYSDSTMPLVMLLLIQMVYTITTNAASLVLLDCMYSSINRWAYLEEKSSEALFATTSFKMGGGRISRVGLLSRFGMYYA